MKAGKIGSIAVIILLLTPLAGCLGSPEAVQNVSPVHQLGVAAVDPEVKAINYPWITGSTPAVPSRDPFVPLVATSAPPAGNSAPAAGNAPTGQNPADNQGGTGGQQPPGPTTIGTIQLLNIYQENGVSHATFSNNGSYADVKVGDKIGDFTLAGIDLSGQTATLSSNGQPVILHLPQPTK